MRKVLQLTPNSGNMSKYSGIVAAIIVAVAAAFLVGWAVIHRMNNRGVANEDRTEHASGNTNQGQYMREVRLRHQEDLASATYGGRKGLVSGDLGLSAGHERR